MSPRSSTDRPFNSGARALQSTCHAVLLLTLLATPQRISADDVAAFNTTIQPYLQQYCVECHNQQQAKGELNLAGIQHPSEIISSFRRWQAVIEFVEGGEMPPAEARQPTLEESQALVKAVRSVLITAARKQAGDPGIVLPRRLTNTEYDLAVRDLTGINIHPTHDFPPDPAAGEGFNNTGEALSMSPSLVKKYLTAAQRVADHLVLRTTGLSFAPFPVTSWNDRRTLAEDAVIDFYQQHDVRLPDYIAAAWRFQTRAASPDSLTAEQFALQQKLSPSYFQQVDSFLSTLSQQPGCPPEFAQAWSRLPAPQADNQTPPELQTFLRMLAHYQQHLHTPEGQLIKPNAGNWPIGHLADRARIAAGRTQYTGQHFQAGALLRTAPVPPLDQRGSAELSLWIRVQPAFSTPGSPVVIRSPLFSKHDQLPRNPDDATKHEVITLRSALQSVAAPALAELQFGSSTTDAAAADSFVITSPQTIQIPLTPELQRTIAGKRLLLTAELTGPEADRHPVLVQAEIAAAAPSADAGVLLAAPAATSVQQLQPFAANFCRVFPGRFCYVDSGRGLSAGFHLVEGFFRDDQPLVSMVLTAAERQELDALWAELDFITESAETLLRGFVWFERSEREVLHDPRFDFLRSEDPELTQSDMLERFEKLYLDKLGVKRRDDTLEAEQPDERWRIVHGFFTDVRRGLQQQSALMEIAAQKGLQDLLQLAEKAWRHPLSKDQQQSLTGLYQRLRDEGQKPEQALRGVLTGILMSPEFSYLYFPAGSGQQPEPLSGLSLASRLSFFLWSSLPDEHLLQAARDGSLTTDIQLRQQLQRMLADPRIQSFAREFFGQWLRFRDFPERDPIDAAAFSWYDAELRLAMAEEPVQFFTRLLQQDRPLTELLNGDSTMLNERLARHYGGILEQRFQQARTAHAQQSAADSRPAAQADVPTWLPVEGLREAGRGGIFGMAVVLAKNSAGDRTSPVKRGFWSVHHLLGQHFPPPPADVPELPKSEAGSDRTIRELLVTHVAAPQCAMCHRHFDSLGLALEGFDATGRARTHDLAGRPIDNTAVLPDGSTAAGIPGLADYVAAKRRDDFLETLCRRFLGYALGRSVQLSDQPLLDDMKTALEQNDFRPTVLFEKVILSPQFRLRGRD